MDKHIFLMGIGVGIVLTSFLAFFIYNLETTNNYKSINYEIPKTNLIETSTQSEEVNSTIKN